MAVEAAHDAALAPFPPGPLLRIGHGSLQVDVAPQAGGRIAQIAHGGIEWLAGYDAAHATMIGWGSFPMLPWAGRLRDGTFEFDGKRCRLPRTLGGHAIHGVGFALPWRVRRHTANRIELSLPLPQDERWPFGGVAEQTIDAGADRLDLHLSITAGQQAMPATIGWHPWLRRPQRLDFEPEAHYPRDADGIATLPLTPPPQPPWDDCFINSRPVRLHREGRVLTLSSDCTHWVVFDEPEHEICVEPQTGPPDAFTLSPHRLQPGETSSAWMRWAWS